MPYFKRYFHPKWYLFLLCMIVSATAQQMQLSLKSPETADKLLVVNINASGFNGMHTARCSLHVDIMILNISEATIKTGVSDLLVSGSFKAPDNTIVLTSTVIDSSNEFSQGTLISIKIPILKNCSEYASAIHAVGGSLELKTGNIVQVNINQTKIRYANDYRLRQDPFLSAHIKILTGQGFNIKGRIISHSLKKLQLSGRQCQANVNSRSGLSSQVLIFR